MKCVICKRDFLALRQDARYCSTNCRSRNYRTRLQNAARGMADEDKLEAQRQAEADRQRKHAARLAAAAGRGASLRSRVPLQEQILLQAPAGAYSYRLILGLDGSGEPLYIPAYGRSWSLMPFQPPDDHRLEEGRTYRLIWLDAQAREIPPAETDQAPGLHYFLGQPDGSASVESREVRELTRTCAALRSQVLQLEQRSRQLEQQAAELTTELRAQKRSKRRARRRLKKAQRKTQAWTARLRWLVPFGVAAIPVVRSYLQGDIDWEKLRKSTSGVSDTILEKAEALLQSFAKAAQGGKGTTPAALKKSPSWRKLREIGDEADLVGQFVAEWNPADKTQPPDGRPPITPSALGLSDAACAVHQHIRRVVAAISKAGQVTTASLEQLRQAAAELKEALGHHLPEADAIMARTLYARLASLRFAIEQAIQTADSELSSSGNEQAKSAQTGSKSATKPRSEPPAASPQYDANSTSTAPSPPSAAQPEDRGARSILIGEPQSSTVEDFFKGPRPPITSDFFNSSMDEPPPIAPSASDVPPATTSLSGSTPGVSPGATVGPTTPKHLPQGDRLLPRHLLMPWAGSSKWDQPSRPAPPISAPDTIFPTSMPFTKVTTFILADVLRALSALPGRSDADRSPKALPASPFLFDGAKICA